MDRNRVTVRYAKAFVELAAEKEITQACYHDICLLHAALNDFPGFSEFMISPGVPGDRKIRKIDELFGKEFHPLTLRFIKMVIEENRREEYLADICRNSIDMIRKDEGISSASLVTAIEITDELKSKIKAAFETRTLKTIELTTQTDPSVIGGFVFTIDGQQYDASIASRLTSIKKQLQL